MGTKHRALRGSEQQPFYTFEVRYDHTAVEAVAENRVKSVRRLCVRYINGHPWPLHDLDPLSMFMNSVAVCNAWTF